MYNSINHESGTLDIITGPMYSGKTTELLRRLFVESAQGMDVLYINHVIDNRTTGPYSTHNPLYKKNLSDESGVTFVSSENIQSVDCDNYDIIGIDEAQFFNDLQDGVLQLVDEKKKNVIVAGLSSDFKREVFGQLISLEPVADTYTKLSGKCKLCVQKRIRRSAPFTKKIVDGENIIDVGGSEKYISVCRECYLS